MKFQLSTLKDIQIILDAQENQFIRFNDIKLWLRENKRANEKNIKSYELLKWFKHNCKSPYEPEPGLVTFSVTSLLQYCFNHVSTYAICKQVVDEIEMSITTKTKVQIQSVKDLYRVVAASKYLDKVSDFFIDEDYIPTLHSEYKQDFSSSEWQKVCLFEKHFSRSNKITSIGKSFEELLHERLGYHQYLENTYLTAGSFWKKSQLEIERRLRRKELSDSDDAVCIDGTKRHSPQLLEMQIMSSIEQQKYFEKIICVDCTNRCKHRSSLHIYTELKEHSFDLGASAQEIESMVNKKHKDICAEILMFSKGTFTGFETHKGDNMRFQIRDKILNGDFNDSLVYQWNSDISNDAHEHSDGFEKCEQCYGSIILQPLSTKSFDIIQEWHLETPLITQIIFEKFINKRSIVKTGDIDSFLYNKYRRLYGLHDACLNTYNKKYHGILQDLQTNVLSMNSESVSTVFDVTSSSGATKSLKTADRNLKQQSESDITYYNTYLKRYPLLYENEIGLTTKMVNLRECALTFMMDNLVRLKFHRDLDPGEHRSMQICTLPITIKGLPLDSTIIKLWHNPSCPGDENVSECNCMKDEHTPAETMQHNILTMNDDEECWLKRFRQLSSLGHKDVWTKILEEHLHMIERSANDGTDDLLEASFLSLNLDDTEEYDVTQWATQNESDESDNEMIDELDENYDMQSIQLDSVILDPTFDMPEFSSEWSFINESFEDKPSSHVEGVFDFESLNTSLDELTSTSEAEVPLSDSLGFHKYTPPPLFTRHPPPAVGRDDDLDKLQEILDDVLIKTDNNKSTSHKILFGADQKISSNLFKLQEIDKKYDIFLPEFPLMHLRKSKITILCSAYKEAGILHILKYMRDEDFNEWKKLIAADHIEMATTYIKRLTISLSIAFFSVFMQSMPESSRSEIESDFTPAKVFENHWEEFVNFLEEGRRRNGTFALHLDILQHCEEVCAISFAERLGGKVGYTLLLAAVKSSLPFSFLNGASSYAAFSTKLLYTHLKCGEYYKNMKFCLFTTPHKGSDTNFALDTQREMDHRDALKAFRSGSTATSILPRMSLVDSLNELQEPKNTNAVKPDDELLGLKTTQTDKKYICRMVGLILRQGGISTVEDERVFNVYDLHRPILSDVILDSKTYGIGRYLMKKFLSQTYSIITTKLPDVEEIQGPTHLLKKLKSFKGVTLKRMGLQSKTIQKNTRIEKESIRKKVVQKETQRIDCLTSEMNACQAVVKPDCSKPAVKKSIGIKQGLYNLLTSCIQKLEGLPIHLPSKILEEKGLVYESVRSLPRPCSETVTMATVEFAGVKFKSFSSSGNQYLKFVQNAIILKSLQQFPNLRQMAICEEKYQFTPDDFKAAT